MSRSDTGADHLMVVNGLRKNGFARKAVKTIRLCTLDQIITHLIPSRDFNGLDVQNQDVVNNCTSCLSKGCAHESAFLTVLRIEPPTPPYL